MGFNFNISFGNNKLPNYVERLNDGSFWYGVKDFFNDNSETKFGSYQKKLDAVLCNPAVLKVLTFRADMYSQVKFNEYNNDKLVEQDFLYSYKKSPNPLQSWIDLHWDISFNRDLGNAYLYVDNDVFYCFGLQNMKIEEDKLKEINKYYFSDYKSKQAIKGTFKARLNCNAEWQTFKLENLYVLSDLSANISGNWLGGSSRIDALYDVVQNSKLSLKAKKKNLFFTTKHIVSGMHDPKDISSTPMGDKEQRSISDSLMGNKEIFATKTKTEVHQLVDNLANLKLDESYLSDLSIIANMYGMTKDILDILTKGSTYENKEKSIGAFIDYSLMPKVQQHSDLLEIILQKEDIRGSFKHLPFNAVFEAEKVANKKIELEALKIASELGFANVQDELKRIYDGY
jgi:hypothetical protein